jgi:hypothetical protein
MLITKTRLLSTAAGLCMLLGSSLANAHVNFDVNIGLYAPPPPPAHVVMVGPPQGYRTCYMTQGMWFNDVWVPAHQQCEYDGPSGPQVWVSGYWGCLDVGPGGRCGQWRWYNRHLIRGGVAYIHPDRFHEYHGAPAYARMYHEQPRGGPIYAHEGPQEAAYIRHDGNYHDRGGPSYGRGPY